MMRMCVWGESPEVMHPPHNRMCRSHVAAFAYTFGALTFLLPLILPQQLPACMQEGD